MKTNILIVDDNINLLKSMKYILSKKNYEIFESSTAKDAFDLISKFHIDIIILDINLPDLNGIEVCKNIKSRINNNILILLLSSENISSEDQSIGFEAGADAYIIRPISNREFLARVESVVRIKKSEDNLRESNNLNKAYTKEIELTLNTLNKIMDYSLDIICTAKDGKFLTINNACEKILGYKPEELINKFCDNFLHTDDLEKTQNTRNKINDGTIINCFENRYIHKNGKIVHLMWSSHSPDKEEIVFCIARDITEKKLMEEQVLKTQKLESLSTFVSGIAHNLNNALTPILMSVDILKNNLSDINTLRIIENVKSSAIHASEMVKEVLTFAKETSNTYKILNIESLLNDIKLIVIDTFPKNIGINFDIKEKLWNVNGDSNQLKQVIVNIFMNSKYVLSNGGLITLKAENISIDDNVHNNLKKGMYLFIEITDNGNGISKEIINNVFDPFFTTKPVGDGTGLGLSTSLSIIKSHKGLIEINSEVNEGTTVKIYIPAFENNEIKEINESPKEILVSKNELILIIDDDELILDMLSDLLDFLGYRAITALGGFEGIDLYIKNIDEVKLVISDMVMPKMDGFETIKALLNINPNLKIIMSSGFETKDKIDKVMEMGVSDFLEKPYNTEKLLKAINKALK